MNNAQAIEILQHAHHQLLKMDSGHLNSDARERKASAIGSIAYVIEHLGQEKATVTIGPTAYDSVTSRLNVLEEGVKQQLYDLHTAARQAVEDYTSLKKLIQAVDTKVRAMEHDFRPAIHQVTQMHAEQDQLHTRVTYASQGLSDIREELYKRFNSMHERMDLINTRLTKLENKQ